MDKPFPCWNDRTMIDLDRLRVFARIADLGSVSGAARALAIPKSSASRALARLEAAMGVALIERSTRHLRLTDAGRLLHRHSLRILDDVGEAEAEVGRLTGRPSGTLRISVGFTFAAGPLAPMLAVYVRRHPDVRVVLSVDNRPVDLLAEDVDVAIRIGPLANSDLIARKLGVIALWACASPAYLAERGVPASLHDLARHRLIVHADRPAASRVRAPGGSWRVMEDEPGAVIPEPAVVKTMLLGDAGIGWLPDFDARDALASGALVRILPDHEVEGVEVHALYPSHRSLSAKVRVFIDMLVQHMASTTAPTAADAERGLIAQGDGCSRST